MYFPYFSLFSYQKRALRQPLKKPTADFLPIRAYLDQSVMPLLTQALSELAKSKYFLQMRI